MHMKHGYQEMIVSLEEKTRETRRRYYSYDKSWVKMESREYSSLEDLEKHVESGRFHLNLEGNRFECFYHRDRNCPPGFLYVIYSGARIAQEESDKEPDPFYRKEAHRKVPMFRRWSYYPMLESLGGAVLFIDDPMILQYEGLLLGWYYGTRESSLLALSLGIVTSVCQNLGVSHEHVIFFGSSGGGYASIYAASLLEGSLAIALNPQTYIQRFRHTKDFEEITGMDLHQPDSLHRNNLAHMIRNSKSSFFLIFNQKSWIDMREQMMPLCEELKVVPKYGLAARDNFLLWVYDAKGVPEPHSAWETRSIFCAMDFLGKKFHLGELSKEMDDLALMVGEFWHDLYEEKSRNLMLEQRLEKARQIVWLGSRSMGMGTEDIVFQASDQKIEADRDENAHYKYRGFSRHTMYSISLETEADFGECALCLYDAKLKNVIKELHCPTGRKVYFDFLTREDVKGINFFVYAGLPGKTEGKVLFIKSLTVMARPATDIAAATSEKLASFRDVLPGGAVGY